jgi:N4-gp56 family major capsid protein
MGSETVVFDSASPVVVHHFGAVFFRADTPLTEGVTPNGQTLNVTTITSDLHQYGGWTPLTDVLQMTAHWQS